ncbi:MAG: transglycosylase SLT domain-containing protein, partial [Rubrivivax sp.]
TLKEALDNPARYLARHEAGPVRGDRAELALAALLRLATQDPEVAATQLARWQTRLPPALAARGWASTGRVAAQRLLPSANDAYASAWRLLPPAAARAGEHGWSDDVLAWGARAALREAATHPTHTRWAQLATTIDAMEASQRDDPTWVYWRARTRLALAPAGDAGTGERSAAFAALRSIAGHAHFYAQLALEDLGARFELPAAPPALSAAEGVGVRARPGLQRALRLIALGLRSEGVREWNFTLRDLSGDREFLAAAQWACEREVWDRCINTSDRTREQIDLAQRYPMPFRADVTAQARTIELDPAYVYGLIRQESRFVTDARSSVGASGLMQLMPATARWTARKIGLDFKPAMVTDRDVNLKLGTSYLKLVLDDFEGRMALGAAAYNAGPNRPRRWREGPTIEAAAWIENIPFAETRDYVKKVLSNAVIYGALLGDAEPSLKRRLGGPIGPRAEGAAGENRELP